MSTVWSRFRTRRRGQQPLDTASSPQVDRLLDSARAPATPPELAREDEVVMLFHRAHLDRATAPRRDDVRPTPSARTGVKAAVVSAGAVLLLSSGVAFAASGHTPWQAAETSAGAGTTATSATSTDDGTPTTGPSTHAFRGLCRAYLSGNKTVHGRALQSPAFTALVRAAAGVDNLATFCASLTVVPQKHPTRTPSTPHTPLIPPAARRPTRASPGPGISRRIPRIRPIRRIRRIRRTPRILCTPPRGRTRRIPRIRHIPRTPLTAERSANLACPHKPASRRLRTTRVGPTGRSQPWLPWYPQAGDRWG